MSATVSIAETNGAGATITASITNANMGNTDAVNLDPVAYPVTPGERTYAKYQRFNVTNMGGSSAVQNLKVWRTSALGGSATHVTNARLTSYAGAASYATPVKTAITGADQAMPTSVPATANLGIGGSLTGSLTATGYSDYLIHQIVTDAGDVAGSTSTMNYQYDEIA
ncbi:MAG: hypothetical protein WA019_04020 [Candidatus Moraniibacteriota bacterium]